MSSIHRLKIIRLFLIILLALHFSSAFAFDEVTERRRSIGLSLFRTLLASDRHINQKANPDNQLNIILIYSGDPDDTLRISERLVNIGRGAKKGKIHGMPIKISNINVDNLPYIQFSEIAGIYIVDKLLEQQLDTVIKIGISHQIIVYSPFEGDVEKGVSAGLAVGIRVLPYINLKALEKAQVAIKALVLKVAKIYED